MNTVRAHLGRLLVISSTAAVLVLAQAGAAHASLANFAPWVHYDARVFPVALASGDFDGDGALDLVAAGEGGSGAVLLGRPDGTFVSSGDYFGVGDFAQGVAVGDFNHDGDPDLAIPDAEADVVSVFLGGPDATFEDVATYPVGLYPWDIALGDFNDDGDLDMVTPNLHSNDLSVLLGRPDGTFGAATTITEVGENPGSVSVADFNGDGDPDIATSTYEDGLRVLTGGPGATFADPVRYDAGGGTTRDVRVASVDADDDPDLVVLLQGEGVALLSGGAGASFSAPTSYAYTGASAAAVGDLNVDGRPDLVIGDGSGFVQVLHGKADGTFGDPRRFRSTAGATDIVVADFNGDHEPDLAVAGYQTAASQYGGVEVLLNTPDRDAPQTTITAAPATLSASLTVQLGFSSSQTGSTFECDFDGAGYAACTTPYTVSSVPEGSHTFDVRATDPSGNTDPTPAHHEFVIDRTKPTVTIVEGPTGLTNDATPTFAFTASEDVVAWRCRIDSAPETVCAPSYTTPALADDQHSLKVWAIDAAGNVGTGTTATFTVDATGPETTVTGGPTGSTADATPTFTFTSSEPGSTFECSIDGAFAPCTTPYDSAELGGGPHTFSVRATDAAGNVDASPATRAFTVNTDITAPETQIISGPAAVTTQTSATFTFASEAGSTFQCRLDAGAWLPCTSPQVYTNVRGGNHTFLVRAVDPAGNPDPTPAAKTWSTLGLLPF